MMKKFIFYLICSGLSLLGANAFAQKTEPVLEEVEYMRTEPGKEEDYLKTEAVWKKIHQKRIANGEILYWALFRRMYPGGTNVAYDYVTVTGYRNGAQLAMKANMSFDKLTEGLTKEEKDVVMATGTVRKLVLNELDAKLLETASNPAAVFVQSRYVKVADSDKAEYEKILETLKPVVEEGIKSGKAASWEVFRTVYPTGKDLFDYTVCNNFTSLGDALKNLGGLPNLEIEYKKIYPQGNFAAVLKRLNEIRKVIGTELWQLVDATK